MLEKNYKNVNGQNIELTAKEYENFINIQKQCNEKSLEYKIENLKNSIHEEILNEYPLHKQIDIIAQIGNYTEQDLNEMREFINNKLNSYQEQKNKLIN